MNVWSADLVDSVVASLAAIIGVVPGSVLTYLFQARTHASRRNSRATSSSDRKDSRAEVGHVQDSAIDAWQQAGPQRVRARLAEAFAEFTQAGLLRGPDPALTAAHFRRLVTLTGSLRPGATPAGEQAAGQLADAVHAFLYGHAGR